jgi:hypothetical protein
LSTKIKAKWGVAVFRDAIIGPVKFELSTALVLGLEEPLGDPDYVDPLNMQHWVFVGHDYEAVPTQLFQNRKNAALYAAGARCARAKLIEAWAEDMTSKFDTETA